MRRDIFVVIFFISYLQFVLTQPIVIDNPTSYPTGQPTNFTDSPYFDANVILIVSLLLVSIMLLSLISINHNFYLKDFFCSMHVWLVVFAIQSGIASMLYT